MRAFPPYLASVCIISEVFNFNRNRTTLFCRAACKASYNDRISLAVNFGWATLSRRARKKSNSPETGGYEIGVKGISTESIHAYLVTINKYLSMNRTLASCRWRWKSHTRGLNQAQPAGGCKGHFPEMKANQVTADLIAQWNHYRPYL